MVRTRNWRFTAEISGGRWNSAPVRVWMARASLAAFVEDEDVRDEGVEEKEEERWGGESHNTRRNLILRYP